jgi:putative endonuclease
VDRKVLGREGEDKAALYLEKKGMSVIVRNFRSRTGEIDIIALHGNILVFAEVKNWNLHGFAQLEYSINDQKQRRIIETAKFFLNSHREYKEMIIRFDVIFIGKDGAVTHLASAFSEHV